MSDGARRTRQRIVRVAGAVGLSILVVVGQAAPARAGGGSWTGSYSGGGRCAAHNETMSFELPDTLPSGSPDVSVTFSYENDACPDANPNPSYTYSVLLYDADAATGGTIESFGCTNSSICRAAPEPAFAAFHGPTSETSGTFTATWAGTPPRDGTYLVLVAVGGDILTTRDRGPVDSWTPARLVVGAPDERDGTGGAAASDSRDDGAPADAATDIAEPVAAEDDGDGGFPFLSLLVGGLGGGLAGIGMMVLANQRHVQPRGLAVVGAVAGGAVVGGVIGFFSGGPLTAAGGALIGAVATGVATTMVPQLGPMMVDVAGPVANSGADG